MNHATDPMAELERSRIIAVVRLPDASRLTEVARALIDGDVRIMEITMTVPGAVEAIARIAGELGHELIIGAGTVLDAETAARVIDAGAAFVVSPVTDPEVIHACKRAGRMVMPGALTPTEIHRAWRAGGDVIKVFPGRVATPGYFRDVRGPLPDIPLMPTGNVSTETAPEYLAAGAIGVGVGKALVDPAAVEAGDMAAITANAQRFRAAVGPDESSRR